MHALTLLVVAVIGVGPRAGHCPCRVPGASITVEREATGGRPGRFFRSAEGGRPLQVRLAPARYRVVVALRQASGSPRETHSRPAPRICLERTIRVSAGERKRDMRVRCRLE